LFCYFRNFTYLYDVIKMINMSAIATVEFQSESQIKQLVRNLSKIYGCQVRPRGRHSNRKSVLGHSWRAGTQNDIPWKQAERVSFYLISK
jgi:hypothetical protein